MAYFLSSVSNKSLCSRIASAWQVDTEMISDGLCANHKASLNIANSAPTENPFSGDEGYCSKPQSTECVHSYLLHAATVNSGQLMQESKGMACLHGIC